MKSSERIPELSPLCILVNADDPSASAIEVLDALPSGRGLRLHIRQGGSNRVWVAATALTAGLRDSASAEPVTDLMRHVRAQWARRICAAHGGWPLHQLIGALLIDGFGVTTAADIARALGTWDRFDKAIDQLCEADIPASREEFVLAHNRRGRAVGVFEPTPDALDHALDLYPDPLSTLLDSCGPRAWRGMQSWGRSPERQSDVEQLLAIAAPLPFGAADYEAFLRERFAGPSAT